MILVGLEGFVTGGGVEPEFDEPLLVDSTFEAEPHAAKRAMSRKPP
jgi:hypothetical protein